MSEENPVTPPQNGKENVARAAVDAAIAVGTGLPPEVQRSFWKAVGRVFAAGAEWPASYLEGRAKITTAKANIEITRYNTTSSELKSEQSAREIINIESAKIAASRFSEQSLSDRALNFHAAHIIKEQKIREDIIIKAAAEINEKPPQKDSLNIIDDDILETVLREGSQRSSEEFKNLFGRILAGEIRQPGTFSIATIQTLGRLTKETAEVFQDCCNLSFSRLIFPRIFSAPFGSIGENKMKSLGFSYAQAAILIEEGLLRSEFDEENIIEARIWEDKPVFDLGNQTFWTVKDKSETALQIPTSLKITGPALTKIGRELMQIVDLEANETYILGVAKWFRSNGLVMYRSKRLEGGMHHGEVVETD